MAARKSEPLVKALRIDAAVMSQQFDQLAAACAGVSERPLHQLLADAAAAAIGGNADVLDQAARGALRAYSGQDAKLQAADDRPTLLRNHELQIRIARDPLERLDIARRQRRFEPLARGPEGVVGQHANDGADVIAAGATDGDRGTGGHDVRRSTGWRQAERPLRLADPAPHRGVAVE